MFVNGVTAGAPVVCKKPEEGCDICSDVTARGVGASVEIGVLGGPFPKDIGAWKRVVACAWL